MASVLQPPNNSRLDLIYQFDLPFGGNLAPQKNFPYNIQKHVHVLVLPTYIKSARHWI